MAIIAGASGFLNESQIPFCASGIVCIRDDELPKMEVAVEIQINELNSHGPLPRAGDPTMGLDNNLMFKNRSIVFAEQGLSSAGTGWSLASFNPFRLILIPDEDPNVRSSVRTSTSVAKGTRRNSLFPGAAWISDILARAI